MSNIDWSQLITAEMKATRQTAQQLAEAVAESASLRKEADHEIAPLQDAVDLDEATDADLALLKLWKKYRVALSKVEAQPGYPVSIDWPAPPA
jgi:Caudovirales tail fibre assembly protein.